MDPAGARRAEPDGDRPAAHFAADSGSASERCDARPDGYCYPGGGRAESQLGGAGLRFGGLSSLVLRRELVGRKCVHEYGRFHARVLALFFLLLSFAGGELILERLQRTQRVLRLLARFRYGFKQPARIGGNFLGCVLYLDFGHLNYAPPRIAIGKYQFSVSTI